MTSPFIASSTFIEIYRNFNVFDQIEGIKLLSTKERYVLLNLCIAEHNLDDPQVEQNFSKSSDELTNLKNLLQNGITDVPILDDLSKNYGVLSLGNFDLKITIEDDSGNDLPELYTREEVRELKLNKILDK